MRLRIEVLGPIRVVADNGATIDVGRPARRRLLSILALANGRRLSTDRVIDRFWGDHPPDTSRAALQTHVAALRREVGDGVIVTEGFGYRLNLDLHELDESAFSDLASEAERLGAARDWERARETIERALALWRGEPFEELTDDDFARPEITRLHELHLTLLERRAEVLIALGHAADALPALEALVKEHPDHCCGSGCGST